MSQPNTTQYPRHDCVTEIEYSCKTTGCWFQDTLATTTTSFSNQLGGVGIGGYRLLVLIVTSRCVTLYTTSTIYSGAAPVSTIYTVYTIYYLLWSCTYIYYLLEK